MENQTEIRLNQGEKAAAKLQPLYESNQTSETFTEIVFKNESGQKLNLTELAMAFNIDIFDLPIQCTQQGCTSQSKLKDWLSTNDYSVFAYSQAVPGSSPFTAGQNQNRFGLIIKIEADLLASSTQPLGLALSQLESFMPSALSVLLSGKAPSQPIITFSDNIYKETDIRYFNLEQGISIDYALAKGSLIFTTSKESMYAALDRLLKNE